MEHDHESNQQPSIIRSVPAGYNFRSMRLL